MSSLDQRHLRRKRYIKKIPQLFYIHKRESKSSKTDVNLPDVKKKKKINQGMIRKLSIR